MIALSLSLIHIYFMLKEIFEQPDCINDCMRGRINADGDKVVLSAVIDHKERLLLSLIHI